MEECLRIFQEAGCAKAPDQDRSRPARQVGPQPPAHPWLPGGPGLGAGLRLLFLQEQEREQRRDKGPSAPSTLLPGQKRRISHLTKRGKEVGAGAVPGGQGWTLACRPLVWAVSRRVWGLTRYAWGQCPRVTVPQPHCHWTQGCPARPPGRARQEGPCAPRPAAHGPGGVLPASRAGTAGLCPLAAGGAQAFLLREALLRAHIRAR